MSVEQQVRDRLRQSADEVVVDDAWDEIARRSASVTTRVRVGKALAVAALLMLGVAIVPWLTARNGQGVIASDGAGSTRVPVHQEPLAPFEHRVTGPVEVLAAGTDAGFAWELFAFPSTYGPCVGVRSASREMQPADLFAGFPDGTFECSAEQRSGRLGLQPMGVPTSPQPTGHEVTTAPFHVGFLNQVVDRITLRVGDERARDLVEHRPTFDASLRVAVVPPMVEGTKYELRPYLDGEPAGKGEQTVRSWTSGAPTVGPRVVVAAEGAPGSAGRHVFMVGQDRPSLICSGGMFGLRGSFGCGELPLKGVSAYAVPPNVASVRFTYADGSVLTTETFGCDTGPPACFYYFRDRRTDRPDLYEGFAADGSRVFRHG